MRRSIILLWCFLFFFLSLFSAGFSSSSSSSLKQLCLHDQLSALLQLKHEQSCSYSYDTLKSWKPNTNCCSWTGVTCDGLTGYVIGLDLSSSGLCGSIHATSGLFHLRHLQSLSLFNNSFNGSISSGFDQFSELKHLNLSLNSFGGQIHANCSLFHLPNLQTLDISYNSFEGSIQYGFDRLLKLTHLDLSQNFFHGRIYDNNSLFCLSNLQTLNLGGNNFDGSVPPAFIRLFRLRRLDLSYNNFDGQIPLEISRLTNLVSLHLSGNRGLKLENPNLRTLIQNLSNLMELHLDSVNMSGHGNTDWYRSLSSMLPNLQQLWLSNCSISRPMDASLSNLHFLSELRLSYNNLSSTVQDLLGKLPSLRVIRLSFTNLYGEFPCNFFDLQPNLQELDLFGNYLLSGNMPEFPIVNSLRYLSLGSTKLCRKLPSSIRNLKLLERLYFDNCSLSGPVPSILSFFANLTNLFSLDFSRNSLTGQIPSFLKDKFPNLWFLYLSNNLLQGSIPSSFANLTELRSLHLSNNNLTGQIHSFFKDGFSNLYLLDLSNNLLNGPIPSFPNLTQLGYLDLSYNNLTGQIHSSFKDGFSNLRYLSLRNNLLDGPVPSSLLFVPFLQYANLMQNQFNGILDDFSHNTKLVGKISTSLCSGTNLEFLDLSYNKLSGEIPRCFGHLIGNLSVLNLEQNYLHGPIPAYYSNGCRLHTLKLNGNRLQGKLPISLANCENIEVLDLGNNQLSDSFPSWLQSLSRLRVLIMRSNEFYGPIRQKSEVDSPFAMLHVFDISHNNFTGKLPLGYILQWKSMLVTDVLKQADYISFQNTSVSYEDSIKIVIKGRDVVMEKIIKTFTIIDLSCNKFQGSISVEIGELKALKGLNLSSNELTGQIPSSFAQLINLESLDLSRNSLSREIPQQLGGLTFLSVLNLSQNHLIGMIPQGNQFATFTAASYEGNVGLCGFPLPKKCGAIERALPPTSTFEKEHKDSTSLLDWRFVVAGYCSGATIGVVIGHTMFWRIIRCFNLTSIIERFKGKKRSKKMNHERVK